MFALTMETKRTEPKIREKNNDENIQMIREREIYYCSKSRSRQTRSSKLLLFTVSAMQRNAKQRGRSKRNKNRCLSTNQI